MINITKANQANLTYNTSTTYNTYDAALQKAVSDGRLIQNDIANYLYNTDVLSSNGTVSIDIEKAHSLGFTQTSYLGLWAGGFEGGPNNQYVKNLLISPLQRGTRFSRGEKFMGICVDD